MILYREFFKTKKTKTRLSNFEFIINHYIYEWWWWKLPIVTRRIFFLENVWHFFLGFIPPSTNLPSKCMWIILLLLIQFQYHHHHHHHLSIISTLSFHLMVFIFLRCLICLFFFSYLSKESTQFVNDGQWLSYHFPFVLYRFLMTRSRNDYYYVYVCLPK